MSEVTKNVIIDLLPLYLAGEVSEDTSALVKGYIASNPEMAEVVDQMAKAESLNQVPIPFSKEVAMKTFQEAKKWTVIRTLGLTLIVGFFAVLALFGILAFVYLIQHPGMGF
jgi:hypothetical protein